MGQSKATVPSNLTAKCDPLQTLDSSDGEAIIKWMLDTIYKYRDCSDRHDRLTDAIK